MNNLLRAGLILFLSFLFVNTIAQKDITMPHGKNFNLECDQCHNTETWQVQTKSVSYDHDVSGFPLLGMHKNVTCTACHKNLVFPNIGSACVDCHTDIHSSEFGFDCQECHTPQSWENRRDMLNQHIQTNFPLLGIHALVDCQSCHNAGKNKEYTNTPVECRGCHYEDYISSKNPDHKIAGFTLACEICHLPNASDWRRVAFTHTPSFPLTGGHASPECNDCHANTYQNTSPECFSCHREDFEQTIDPDHAGNGFSHDCQECHSTIAWLPARFDHNNTDFMLTGKHSNLTCQECHGNGYTGTPVECNACHRDDYNQTIDPDHQLAQFPLMCTECHSTTGWKPAQLDHNNTDFPLTGRHSSVACQACHANGYTNTPSECVDCHRDEYDQTTNPNHQAVQFPLLCNSCHSTTDWSSASWDHDGLYIPIYSGRHRGEWNTCSDCHINPANYTLFECIYCHEHTKSETDSHHREISNYQYNSQACYTCHPRGEAEDD